MIGLLRAAYGTALVVAPGRVLALVGDERADRRALVVARVLGARHVAEALVLHRHPAWRRAGAAVDGCHAASMVLLAALDARRRVPASLSAATAAALALEGWRAGR